MAEKNIITVQHTQSVHHTNGMVGSVTDWELTEEGRRQADRIGRKLAKELSGSDAVIYSSDLLRARQTAEIIAGHLGCEVILRKELRERDLGKACGRSVRWLRDNIECDEKTIDDRMFSDAESRRDVWNRLGPFLAEMLADGNGNVIIVSHGDTLSVLRAMFLGLEPESLNGGGISGRSGGVSHLSVKADGSRTVDAWDDLTYMEDTTEEKS